MKMSCCVPNCQFKNAKVSQHLFPDPTRFPHRHLQWMRSISSEKLYKFDPEVVFKRFRVCRKHFTKDCFNGECKKLLNQAVPQLYLPSNSHSKTKYSEYEAKVINLLKTNSLNNFSEDSLKLITLESNDFSKKYENELDMRNDDEEEDFMLMEIVNESQSEYTIVLPSTEVTTVAQSKINNFKKSIIAKPTTFCIESPLKPILAATLSNLRTKFFNSQKNIIAQNICTKIDPLEIVSMSQMNEDFRFKINLNLSKELKDRGPWWYQPAFIILRNIVINQWNLDEFEFSQAHFFYWDTIERSYYFLNNIVETVKRGESVEGRLVSFLLSDPIGDGGQWDMIVNIINKHGLMPKKCFPESFSSESSARMNAILKSKLREYSKVIRDLMNVGASNTEVQTKVDEQMGEIYNIVGICLGIPPEKFTFEYYDKNKKYTSIGPITPIEFYEQYVKAYYNVDDKVCLVTDPRPTNEFGKAYTVDCLGNVVGGRPVFYNNQPVDVLIDLITKSLKDNEAVLFACDLCGLNNINLKNFKLIADEVKLSTKLEKFDRIALKDATKKLLMIIIGFNFDLFGKPQNLLIEPLFESKSSFSISCENFEEVVSEIIIDRRKFASDTQVQVLNSNPIVLDIWDYLGLTCK